MSSLYNKKSRVFTYYPWDNNIVEKCRFSVLTPGAIREYYVTSPGVVSEALR